MYAIQYPSSWTPCRPTAINRLEGRHVVIEKLDFKRHYAGIHELYTLPDVTQRMAYLLSSPPKTVEEFDSQMSRMLESKDPEYYAVVDKASGLVSGLQSFMRFDLTNGVVEIGSVYYGPRLARTTGATEAVYLAACHIFDALHFRRFDWKCNNRNANSKRAARRLGFTFEGIQRWHTLQKGSSRDTAWYSILDSEWPLIKRAMEIWLDEGNFEAGGIQRRCLEDVRKELGWVEKDLGVPDYESAVLPLPNWTPKEWPTAKRMEGRFVILERLSATKHFDDLYALSTLPDAAERMYYMKESPPTSPEQFLAWMHEVEASIDPIYFAVIDKKTGRVGGRQCLMRCDPANGVAEIGWVLWGPEIARHAAATEALYLAARYVLDELGYRRFEWRHHVANEPSRVSAKRFGFQFEGVFRQIGFLKGENKDLAFHSILNDGREWPLVREAMEAWLSEENFDAEGKQKHRLAEIREQLAKHRSNVG